MKLGCHFSFAGAVIFEGARKPLDAVRAVPLDRVMAETDAPDQTPTSHRGVRNEPAYLPNVVAALTASTKPNSPAARPRTPRASSQAPLGSRSPRPPPERPRAWSAAKVKSP